MIKLTALVFLLLPIVANAAPFCLSVPGKPLQCTYFNGPVCSRDAGQQTNGACIANPADDKLPVDQMGSFCLVVATGIHQCGYSDINMCNDIAQREHGICARSDGTLTPAGPNPYTTITAVPLDHLNH